VVGADNKATPRILTLGPVIGARWLVTGGLQPGERVIVDGLQKVRPGAPVLPQVIAAKA
jgi:membrane fusion protein (multidrug efflux system)